MKGILYTKENIEKVYAGTKTVTRRLRGLEKINECPDKYRVLPSEMFLSCEGVYLFMDRQSHYSFVKVKPPYREGEIVYVKEAWKFENWDMEGGRFRLDYKNYDGLIDDDFCITDAVSDKYWLSNELYPEADWRSPIFMPAWAARRWQRILSVRPEQLQDITEEDAVKEGVTRPPNYSLKPNPIAWFIWLWNSINKKFNRWDDNPWVWRIETELLKEESCTGNNI